jgi:hypothetical protein
MVMQRKKKTLARGMRAREARERQVGLWDSTTSGRRT